MTYGFIITQTDRDGSISRWEVSGCKSAFAAKLAGYQSALLSGWEPPKWWQWWRIDDTKIDFEFLKEVCLALPLPE